MKHVPGNIHEILMNKPSDFLGITTRVYSSLAATWRMRMSILANATPTTLLIQTLNKPFARGRNSPRFSYGLPLVLLHVGHKAVLAPVKGTVHEAMLFQELADSRVAPIGTISWPLVDDVAPLFADLSGNGGET